MQIGMTLPSMIAGIDRAVLIDWCRRVDAGPFSTLAAGERVTYPTQDLFVTLGAAAAITERVRIMSTVVIAPMHSAVDVAKKAATIDVISGGRMVLGLGVGGRDEDYRAMDASFGRRHQRMDDQVAVMRRIWAGEPPAPDMEPVGPAPVQTGGPPLYCGALGPKAIARSARWAQGVSGFVFDPLGEDLGSTFSAIEQAWVDAGRPDAPRHVTSFWFALGADAASRLEAYARRYLAIFGDEVAELMAATCSVNSVGALRDAVARLEEAGCDELLLVPTSADVSELDLVSEVLGRH